MSHLARVLCPLLDKALGERAGGFVIAGAIQVPDDIERKATHRPVSALRNWMTSEVTWGTSPHSATIVCCRRVLGAPRQNKLDFIPVADLLIGRDFVSEQRLDQAVDLIIGRRS